MSKSSKIMVVYPIIYFVVVESEIPYEPQWTTTEHSVINSLYRLHPSPGSRPEMSPTQEAERKAHKGAAIPALPYPSCDRAG